MRRGEHGFAAGGCLYDLPGAGTHPPKPRTNNRVIPRLDPQPDTSQQILHGGFDPLMVGTI
jgi:hypothetical protein